MHIPKPHLFTKHNSIQRFRDGYMPLEGYGIIGNLETIALIAQDGAIDWLCLPHMESESVFARLLDKDKGGVMTIRPVGKHSSSQRYIERTNILQTIFTSDTGTVIVTDFMPPFKKRSVWHATQTLFRRIECTQGYQQLRVIFEPRFNYARGVTKVKHGEYGLVAEQKDQKLFLDSFYHQWNIKQHSAQTTFTLSSNEETWFTLQYNQRSNYTPQQARRQLVETKRFWQSWAHSCTKSQCVFNGPYHDLVVRSGLVLKLLTHGETGAIAAAATTSLPEQIGGERNWDYRYNWIRDSVFTAQALYNLGHHQEARNLLSWYKKIYKNVRISDIKIMHGLHGETKLPEKKLNHLSGYRNSQPVRIGNAAVNQFQHDIYGELLNTAFEISRYGESISHTDWKLLKRVVDHVCTIWHKPDKGIWEMRAKPRHFVFSKVMCWVAIDRGILIAEKKKFKAPLHKWKKIRDEIHTEVLEKGFDQRRNTFVQSYDSQSLDATSLLLPLLGFLPFTDKRIQGTIDATIKKLTKNNLVYRYKSDDGLSGDEGTFILCTCWLIDALTLSGRRKEAKKILASLVRHCSPLGLLAEEIELTQGKYSQLGNFPQAFSHIGLINSVLYLGLTKDSTKQTVRPLLSIKQSVVRVLKQNASKIKSTLNSL